MNELSTYDLEKKAAEERERLQSSVAELRSRLSNTLDVRKNMQAHLGLACGIATALGLTLGYSVTGIFVRNTERKARWPY